MAPATYELPLPKRGEAKALRANLGKFQMTIQPPLMGGGDGGRGGLGLVTDSKLAAPKAARPMLAITEKQAGSVIDYLDENRLFDDMYDFPPGIPQPGWFVYVEGAGREWLCAWRFPPDADLSKVGLFQCLLKTLDGDARGAVERIAQGTSGKRR